MGRSMRRMARVLLADSQPLFNEALESLLSRDRAHQVVGCCPSAEQAFMVASRLNPDLILVDDALGLDGSPSLIKRILQSRPDVKVVVLGDDHDPDLMAAAIRSGPAGALGKTHGASTVLRVTQAVMAGEAAMPRTYVAHTGPGHGHTG